MVDQQNNNDTSAGAEKCIMVCTNHRSGLHNSCGARGSEALAARLEDEIAQKGWHIELKRSICLGRCNEGPNLKLVPGGQMICAVNVDHLESVLAKVGDFISE
ncbi:MAG: (2Fe-2S) ferredoxin domain-containing protein [Mariprofundus sp.]|nr:(2Fe-2S) ferredoxin domain-containing protein [Mariprofundus sp.]